MKKRTVITTAIAVGLGLLGSPAFAGGYEVDGRAAAPAETQLLASHGAQRGEYAVEPTRTTEDSAKKCWYVLDVLLCD